MGSTSSSTSATTERTSCKGATNTVATSKLGQAVAQGAKCQISLSSNEWAQWTGTLDEGASSTLKDALLRIGDDFSFTQDGRTVQGVIRIERSRAAETP